MLKKKTNSKVAGNEFIENATTDGKFVILDLTVENAKSEAITIDSSYFKIITEDGTEYDPITDGDAMMALGDSVTDFFLKQINPNLKKSGKVAFEVSGDIDLAKSKLKAQPGFFGTETIEISLSK